MFSSILAVLFLIRLQLSAHIACLLDQNKRWLFRRAGFYPANQSNLKSFLKALIGWKKTGSPKKPLLF